jgi:PTS system nitrogen regulatory IIA component
MDMTVRDASRVLNVSEKTIYRWITKGVLPAYRINEQYRFNRAELLEWVNSKRNLQVSPDLFREQDNHDTPLPTLSAALKAGGIVYRVGGKDKPSVLRSMVECMQLPDAVDREFLYQVLLARESLGSTAVGEGVALPHPRNPIVLRIEHPLVNLSFLEEPVDFGALDGQKVHTLFSLVSPTVRVHLHLLARLAFALRNREFKEALRQQLSRERILSSLEQVEASFVRENPAPQAGTEVS